MPLSFVELLLCLTIKVRQEGEREDGKASRIGNLESGDLPMGMKRRSFEERITFCLKNYAPDKLDA
ncbi:hypothetical protein YSY43_02740 [Paenibacillus sp. YSY-4.3]